jgi:uncharacterized protein
MDDPIGLLVHCRASAVARRGTRVAEDVAPGRGSSQDRGMGEDPPEEPAVITLFVDADACPVKAEIYRVASRYGVPVKVVANAFMRIPDAPGLELVVVPGGFDEADDWIVERAGPRDIVVTADIPLAARSLEKGARVLDHKGGVFTEDTIGEALASRELLSQLRQAGAITGGPAPFEPRDRSRFLQRLDETIQALRRQPR